MAGKKSYEWSSLASDIVHLISTKLHDLSDLARLRAVCKSWRSAINPLSYPSSSPRLPWLVAYHATDHEILCYYSLSSNKLYKIKLPNPQPERAYFLSAAGGRLLCCQDHPCWTTRSISLLNPLTGIAVPLPPLDDHIVNLTVVSSVDPSSQEEFVAIAGADSLISHTFVSIVRPGDDEAWEPIPLSISYHGSVRVYHEGLYYINHDRHEHTWIFNTVGEMLAEVPCHAMFSRPIARQYILASCGKILVILRHFSDKLEDVSFSIFRLDRAVNGEYDYQWVEVRGIGDQMLFLHFGTGFSLPSSDFAGFKGNCIYFLEDESFYFPDSEGERKYAEHPAAVLLRRHDLENGATQSLPNFSGNWGSWFFPKFV